MIFNIKNNMVHFAILFTLAYLIPNYSFAGHPQSKIIGGTQVTSNKYPWMVGLVFHNTDFVFCGGSLIAKRWVLTAAHCLINKSNSAMDALINRNDITSNKGERITISRFEIHPDFNKATLENDLALAYLDRDSNVEPIEILSSYSNQDGVDVLAQALGWGNTDPFGDNYPDQLMTVNLPLVDNSTCSLALNMNIPSNMLCAGDGQGIRDTCVGDSGGPLIALDSETGKLKQVGITSFGIGRCAQADRYGVYTRTKEYKQFISDKICEPKEVPLTPELKLSVNNTTVTATWTTDPQASGYRLYYAPYPSASEIYSIEVSPQQMGNVSYQLPVGTSYYVAVSSYKGNCSSPFSNITNFTIK